MRSPRPSSSIAAAVSGSSWHHSAGGAGECRSQPAEDVSEQHSECSSVPDSEPQAPAAPQQGLHQPTLPTVSAACLLAAARELDVALLHARQARAHLGR